MGLLSGRPAAERRADLDRYRSSRKAQNNYRSRDGREDATARQLNDAVIEAERNVSWWKKR